MADQTGGLETPATILDSNGQIKQIRRKIEAVKKPDNPPPAGRKEIMDALIDLYLSVKIRPKGEIAGYTEEHLAQERHKIKKNNVPIMTLIEYIKTSIDILMNLKSIEVGAGE